MTLGQQLNHLNQRPAKTLRPWQRKARILARKASHEGQVQSLFIRRIWSALLILLVVALIVLANSASRHWLATSFANIAIVGGITAAPIISLVAWIGVALPVHAPLHQAAPTLFIGALLWMAMAFVSAHARRDRTADR
jgi:hypothetical protein